MYLLTHILSLAGIDFTEQSVKQVVESFEIDSITNFSSFLDHYRIANMAVRLQPSQLAQATFPCIAHCLTPNSPSYFIVIEGLDNGLVAYFEEGKGMVIENIETFSKIWSGSLLLLAPDAQSGEPNYAANKRQEGLKQIEKGLTVLSLSLFFAVGLWYSNTWPVAICWLLAWFGLGVSVLLLLQEVGVSMPIVQKICGLGNKESENNCGSVTQSSGAKLFGWLSWSEVGIVYFIGLILSIFINSVNVFTAIVVFFTLLFVPYSLYYQAFIVKKWCVLCLLIQAIFLLQSFVFLGNPISIQNLLEVDYLKNITTFLIGMGLWFLVRHTWFESRKVPALENIVSAWQHNSELFMALLAAQPLVELGLLPHEDQIGNVDAPVVVTMVSNPHCGPCQDAHKELTDWVAFFEDEMQLRIRHINTGDGKYETHEAFAKQIGLEYTPTIFINGHQLKTPYSYKDIGRYVRALAAAN